MGAEGPLDRAIARRTMLTGMGAGIGIGALAGLMPVRAAAVPARPLFGVNYHDLFTRTLASGQQASDPVARLREAARQKIPFARFAASPFWPNDWTQVGEGFAKAEAIFDLVVKAAGDEGIRLVPSVFFNAWGLTDHLGEHVAAWGDPASRTRRFAHDYVEAIVGKHAGNATIMAWEFSNEFNDFAGLPNSERWWPMVKPDQGTPPERTAADRISWDQVASAYSAFAAQVRTLDPGKPVSSGSNIPRLRMMRQIRGEQGAETTDDFAQALPLALAGGTDWLSLHLYAHSARGHFGEAGPDYARVLGMARTVATARNAKLFIGEFGVPDSGNADADKAQLQQQFEAMTAAHVDYAALWVYDLSFMPEFSVTGSNARAWQLGMMREANQAA